eukprot:COSAG01_NODE_699_length_14176_cov_21.100590_17_plen_140_part_00
MLTTHLRPHGVAQFVERWNSTDYLLEHFGDTEHRTGLFVADDLRERVGIMPHSRQEGGQLLLRQTHTVQRTLRQLLGGGMEEEGGSNLSTAAHHWFAEQSQVWGEQDEEAEEGEEAADGHEREPRHGARVPSMWADMCV